MAYKSKVSWTIRIEPNLKKRLTLIAKAEKRSLNNLIEYLLEYMVDYYEKAPIYRIDDLLSCYHECFYSTAFSPAEEKGIQQMLAHDREDQQQKLKAVRRSD